MTFIHCFSGGTVKGQPSTSAKRLQVQRAKLVADFDAAEARGDISAMESLVASIETIDESIATLTAAAVEDDAATETEASAEVAETETDEDETEDDESEESEDVEDTAVAEAPAEPEAVAETADAPISQTDEAPAAEADTPVANTEESTAMAASGSDIQVPEDHAPVVAAAGAPTIVAGTDIPGFSAGQVLSSGTQIAEAFVNRLGTLRRVQGGDGDQHIVASIRVEYPEDRVLSPSDTELNSARIEAVTSPEALVASGGWCAPLPTRYEIYGLGDGARPLRDSLPKFNATRGGVQYNRPAELKDYRGAVGFMDGSDGSVDLAFGGVTLSFSNGDIVGDGALPAKPVLDFTCPTPEKAIADAVTLSLKFGNLTSRAYPELVANHNRLALIQHARLAENILLAKMYLFAAQEAGGVVLADGTWGAVRDTLVSISKAAVYFRFRHRLRRDFPLNFVAPQWLLDVMREDLFVGLPGDQLELADSKIAKFFADRNIRPIWHLDGFGSVAGATIGSDTFRDSNESNPDPVIATSEGSPANFPGQVTGYLFAEGSLLFLDAGTLDLGIIRDSTLVGTNDYQTFVETFEGLANIGYRPMAITAPVNIAGATSGTITAPISIATAL